MTRQFSAYRASRALYRDALRRTNRRRFLGQATALAAAAIAGQAAAEPGLPFPATGIEQPELASFDRLLREFCREHEVPGAALAVTHERRLVYARGFGLADRDAQRKVEPTSLFRIASISKPLTAVATLQMVERKQLDPEASVHALLKLPEPKDPRWRQVTVRHLLQHTGGWDSAQSFDPMFRPLVIAREQGVAPPAMPEHIIRYMAARPLDFNPGTRYAYSNFGYCLLGRVIEQAARQPYEQLVRTRVLSPLRIRRTKLGRTLLEARAEGEVRYYDELNRSAPAVIGQVGVKVALPYGAWHLEAMDAHGGWIASAVDLARFSADFDDRERSVLLSAQSIATMFERPFSASGFDASGQLSPTYYGCGWNVRPVGGPQRLNTWHAGGLDGTSTLLVRRHDGLNWAVLFNTRADRHGKELAAAIDGPLHTAADAVRSWPKHDLFARYL